MARGGARFGVPRASSHRGVPFSLSGLGDDLVVLASARLDEGHGRGGGAPSANRSLRASSSAPAPLRPAVAERRRPRSREEAASFEARRPSPPRRGYACACVPAAHRLFCSAVRFLEDSTHNRLAVLPCTRHSPCELWVTDRSARPPLPRGAHELFRTLPPRSPNSGLASPPTPPPPLRGGLRRLRLAATSFPPHLGRCRARTPEQRAATRPAACASMSSRRSKIVGRRRENHVGIASAGAAARKAAPLRGRPGSNPGSNPLPGSNPGSNPGFNPGSTPGSNPRIQPQIQPRDQPRSQPRIQPRSKPDPMHRSQPRNPGSNRRIQPRSVRGLSRGRALDRAQNLRLPASRGTGGARGAPRSSSAPARRPRSTP